MTGRTPQEQALLAPLDALFEAARKVEGYADLLARAGYQVREPADAAELARLAKLAYHEAHKMRAAIPVPKV